MYLSEINRATAVIGMLHVPVFGVFATEVGQAAVAKL
jgi:hypothetical protein